MVTKHANMSGKHRPGQLDANAVDHDIGCGHRVYGSVFDAQASADLFETEVVGGHFARHAVNADMPAARANRPAGDRGDAGDAEDAEDAEDKSRDAEEDAGYDGCFSCGHDGSRCYSGLDGLRIRGLFATHRPICRASVCMTRAMRSMRA